MKRLIVAAAAALILPTMTFAAELKVLSTQATEDTYRELVPQFEKATGHKVTTVFTGTLDAQKRLAAGESYDMIIMAGPAIDAQIKAGNAVSGSRVDLAKSGVGAGVPKGAPKPDISTTHTNSAEPCGSAEVASDQRSKRKHRLCACFSQSLSSRVESLH
jgi:molybdate transport system substrate-binding protein